MQGSSNKNFLINKMTIIGGSGCDALIIDNTYVINDFNYYKYDIMNLLILIYN